MEFGLSSEQKMLQDSLEATLNRACPLDRVRQAVSRAEPYAADVWETLVELGLPGLLIDPEFGGLGLGGLEAALAAEALGRAVAPVPFVGACAMAPVLIGLGGSAEQQARWLPGMASGGLLAGVAVAEQARGARDTAGVIADSGRLNGRALFAFDALGADILLVADISGGVHVVAADAAGLEIVPLTTIDRTRSACELILRDVEAEPLAGDVPTALAKAVDLGRVVLGADALGAAQRMLEKAVAYSLERVQFGRAIGSFQAVKHLCAEMAAELEPCRSLMWYAAHALDAAPDEASRMAAHFKSLAAEATTFVARSATEVHGGMGFTDLLGLHYWFKRIGFDRQALGGPERLREELAALQGWAA